MRTNQEVRVGQVWRNKHLNRYYDVVDIDGDYAYVRCRGYWWDKLKWPKDILLDEEDFELVGGAEDELLESILDNFRNQWEQRGPIWVTANGEHIPVTELEDSHLENILNMLIKRKGDLLRTGVPEEVRGYVEDKVKEVNQWLEIMGAEYECRKGRW